MNVLVEIRIELDLSSYPTKNDLKNATGVDTSTLATTTSDLASFLLLGT